MQLLLFDYAIIAVLFISYCIDIVTSIPSTPSQSLFNDSIILLYFYTVRGLDIYPDITKESDLLTDQIGKNL